MIAPERDIVRVEEITGPRGGRTIVLHLSCGCFLTRSSKAPPPKRARCTPCLVMRAHPELAVVTLNHRELELAHRLAEVYRMTFSVPVHGAEDQKRVADDLFERLQDAKSQWAQRGGDM